MKWKLNDSLKNFIVNFSLNISNILWIVKITKISWFVHNDLNFLNDLIELIVLIMNLSIACDHSIFQFELLKFVWVFSHDMFWICLSFLWSRHFEKIYSRIRIVNSTTREVKNLLWFRFVYVLDLHNWYFNQYHTFSI